MQNSQQVIMEIIKFSASYYNSNNYNITHEYMIVANNYNITHNSTKQKVADTCNNWNKKQRKSNSNIYINN